MSVSRNWPRGVLVAAAAWNILGGIGALLDPAQHFAQMYNGALDLSDPVQRSYFHTVWIAVIAWGLAYLGAALQPLGRTAVLLAGGAGKLAYAGACAVFFLQGAGTPAMLAVGIVDLVFASLFAIAALEGAPATRSLPSHAAATRA